MALLQRHRRVSDDIPTSSTADIAFLLLVFFLVTTVFPKDRGLTLALPQGEAPVNEGNVLHFLVESSGKVGIRWGASENTHYMASQDIAPLWRTEVAKNPKLIAAVRTDPLAPYSRMIDVLDQLRMAGAERVSLASGEGGS